jgi:hypothetical protein
MSNTSLCLATAFTSLTGGMNMERLKESCFSFSTKPCYMVALAKRKPEIASARKYHFLNIQT